MLPLVIGTLLAVGALAFVLFPLFSETVVRVNRAAPKAVESEAVAALREIEFDRATGKLSDDDYEQLRDRYTRSALASMRNAESNVGVDVVEAAVLEYRNRLRSCGTCGPRPEPDAIYCSNCGTYLPGACEGCGVQVSEKAAAFCRACGRQLAA